MAESDVWVSVFRKLAALDGHIEEGIDAKIQVKKLKNYFKGESSLRVRVPIHPSKLYDHDAGISDDGLKT